jgi:hypothetical protein
MGWRSPFGLADSSRSTALLGNMSQRKGGRRAKRMATVFINYRRHDSAGNAGRVHDRLKSEFGDDLIFMDVTAIPFGVNFAKYITAEVAKCDLLLVLIGPDWLNAQDNDGNRRLDNPNDLVRLEIATALARDIPVVPIMLDGARIPKEDELPADISELSMRNGLDVRHASSTAIWIS